MPRLEVVPFADDHLDEAGRLLAERHARHRTLEPLLSPAPEDPFHARAEVAAAWEREDACGTVAVSAGDVVGYLIAAPRDGWGGPNVWVEPAGHAADEPEIVRDLYAVAAADWVEAERTRHYALVPFDQPLVDAWFRLGFGAQQAHGIRELAPGGGVPSLAGIELRRAGPEDVDDAATLELVLPEHQERSPVFAAFKALSGDDARAEWRETLEDERMGVFVAWRDGRAVGGVAIAPVEYSSAHTGVARPDGAAILGWAATVAEERGTGVGRVLTDAALAWAHEQGYRTMVTDWRETNLLASRFWPARGFRRSFLRLYRSIP